MLYPFACLPLAPTEVITNFALYQHSLHPLKKKYFNLCFIVCCVVRALEVAYCGFWGRLS